MSPNRRMLTWFIGTTVAWQLVVYVLITGGIFVNVYELIGIPWNSAGFANVVGTLAGFVLLESPVIAFGVILCFRAKVA